MKAPLQTFDVPSRRFDHIHVDLVGPLPPSRGYSYLFTIVDRFTRWPEAIPINDTTATGCAETLVANWISRFGVPSHISSDRGPQFTSTLWSAVCRLLGTKHHRTTAWHPQSNGLVERFHRSLKSSLRARLTGPNWCDDLPWVLLEIRTAPKEDLNSSSAELVYGAPLSVPGDFIPSAHEDSPRTFLTNLREKIYRLRPSATSRHGVPKVSVPDNLQDSKFVFIRRDHHRSPLQRPYEGPFLVVASGEKTFQVRRGNTTETISIDRLKPAHLDIDQPIKVAQPRPRGRPRTDPTPPSAVTRSGRTFRKC